MKKGIIFALAALFLMGNVFAVNPNLTIDYVRMFARYATVNSPDAAVFNPAGLPKLENGLYVDISNQFVYKKYGFNIGTGFIYNADSTRLSYFFPSASVSYKLNNWAVFFNFTIPDGGGVLEYKTPSYIAPGVLGEMDIKASSSWFDLTLGGSYAINDMFALSLGVRMLMPSQSTKADIFMAGTRLGGTDDKYKGMGFSGQFGVNITPIKKLNIGILYKSQALWVTNDKVIDGKETFYAPNIIQVGVGYDVLENLNVQFGYKINLESLQPELETDVKYNNSMDFSLGAEWQVTKFIKPSLGVAYQMSRGTEKTNSTQAGLYNPDLNAFAIGVGAVITPVKNLNITVGYMIPLFTSAKYTDIGLELEKTVHVFGIGVSYKFF